MTDRPEPGYYWARVKLPNADTLLDWEIIDIGYDWRGKIMIDTMGSDTGGYALEYYVKLVGPLQPPEYEQHA